MNSSGWGLWSSLSRSSYPRPCSWRVIPQQCWRWTGLPPDLRISRKLFATMGYDPTSCNTHTHTHTFNSPLSGTIRVSRNQKRNVKPTWILLKRETVSGSGISWAICKSAPRSRQIIMPAPHHSVFTGRMPFLPPNQEHQSTHTHTRLTALFRDYPGEPVPER